jgi:hypothetical protein
MTDEVHSPNVEVLKGEHSSADDIGYEIQQLLGNNWNLPGLTDVLQGKNT